MSRVAILCVLVVFLGLGLADETYTANLDNVDPEAVFKNERLFSKYKECLLGEDDSNCINEQMKELRSVLADALATDCAKCTDGLKQKAEQTITYLRANQPEFLEVLLKQYDPSGSFLKKHPE